MPRMLHNLLFYFLVYFVVHFQPCVQSQLTSFSGPLDFVLFFSLKYLENIQIQNDAVGSMELHSNPVVIAHKQLKEKKKHK